MTKSQRRLLWAAVGLVAGVWVGLSTRPAGSEPDAPSTGTTAKESAVGETNPVVAETTTIPPIDQQIPAKLATATFAMG